MWFYPTPVGALDSTALSTAAAVNESAIFFPAYAAQDERGDWQVRLRAWFYEPMTDRGRRDAALKLFGKGLGLRKKQRHKDRFARRASMFVVYPRPGRPVTVRIAGEQRCLGSTGRNGHIESTITLTDRQVRQVRASNEIAGGCLPVQLVGQRPHDPPVIGPVHLLPREGLSVISDIDDTIKVSHVGSHRKLLAHTFVRRYRPVKGIADIYRGWHEQGARFHYVSSTPWQLYLPLSEFFEKVKLPGGTFHLKLFRWRDSSFFDLFASPKRTKRRAIEPILHDLPNRRFILVGDAGEKDPEVYGALARQHPERIVRIFIRNLKGDSPDAPRYRKAFDGIDRKSWCLFDDPRELIDLKLD